MMNRYSPEIAVKNQHIFQMLISAPADAVSALTLLAGRQKRIWRVVKTDCWYVGGAASARLKSYSYYNW